MKHWLDVLERVRDKDAGANEDAPGSVQKTSLTGRPIEAVLDGVLFDKKRYYFDQDNPDAYLTCREAQCMYYLLHGCTLMKTAEKLQLSHRTVEFYVKNIKMKLNLITKSELIAYMMRVNFLSCIDKSL